MKFCNTLVVKNHKGVFGDELMYMSGPPLHVLAMNLVQKFRERLREPIPISFSGGLDAHNIAAAVAMNFVPVTTCTDLLRPGGYWPPDPLPGEPGREDAGIGVTRHSPTSSRYRGQAEAHGRAYAGLNTPIWAEATANPRYSWERNHGVPRKIGTKLWLYDCINCDKCVPVCPNDANFAYETRARHHRVRQFRAAARRRAARARRRAARREGAPARELRRRLQRMRQLRHLLPRRGRTATREAALFRQPRKLPAARRRERLLHRLGRPEHDLRHDSRRSVRTDVDPVPASRVFDRPTSKSRCG